VSTLLRHPDLVTHPDFVRFTLRSAVDIFEDVVLGLVPGLAALRTRRLPVLLTVTAVTAWLSLPFLVIANPIIDGHAGAVWHALGTRTGDWDQPVDPSLTEYALLAGALDLTPAGQVHYTAAQGTARQPFLFSQEVR